MNKTTPGYTLRRFRTSIALLLAYFTLLSPLAPVFAQTAKVKRVVTPQQSVGTQPGKSKGGTTGGVKQIALPAPNAAQAAVITATKIDSFPDLNGDAKADPGETITYTVTITNTGNADANNVAFNDTIDANTAFVVGSVNTQPIALDDTYTAVGNVRIQPNAAQGLLANDRDPDNGNNTLLTASGPTTTTQGGNLTINSNGSFIYNPAPGFAGTDTFTYTITDAGADTIAGNADDKTDTATATISVGNGTATPGTNVIWFINPTATTGGDGRLTTPFNCFVGTSNAGQTCFSDTAADDPGDAIFLFSGNHTGGYAFFANQKLIGQGATATLASIASVTPPAYSDALPATGGASPLITTTTLNALTVSAGGILLRGFTVGNTGTGAKILGSTFGTLTVGDSASPDVTLNGTGQALSLTNGTLSNTSGLNGVTTTSSGTQGILLSNVAVASAGTVSFGSTSVSGSTTQGIFMNQSSASINFGNTSVTGGTDGVSLQNNSAGTRTFGTLSVSGGSGEAFLHSVGGGNTTVNGAATLSSSGNAVDIQNAAASTAINFASSVSATRTASGGAGVNLANNSATSTVTFNSLSITTNAGTGLSATGGGTINVTNGTGSINSTPQAAPAIVANGVALNANFSSVSSSGGTNGISLTNVTGTSNFGTGSLAGASGATFLASGGTATVTYNGTITQNNAARVVDIQNTTGGTVTLGGAVSTTGTSSTGVILNANTGATINFTGGVAITTSGANPAFTATGGGTVSVTGSSNTLTSGAATALNVSSTNIGASGLTFLSIAANGASKGIILNTTGSSGGLSVTGTGTTAGSGGTIQNISLRGGEFISTSNLSLKNMNFTNANTTDAGGVGVCDDATTTACNAVIYLSSTTTVTLDRINITGTIAEEGINVNGLTLSNSTIGNASSHCGDAVEEGCMKMRQWSGSGVISNSTLSFAAEDVVEILNTSGTLTLNVSGSTFSDTQPNPPGSTGIIARSRGTGSMIINVTSSNFLRLRSNAFNATSQDSANLDVDVSTSTFDSEAGIGIGVVLASDNTSNMVFNIQNNPKIWSRNGIAVSVLGDGTSTFTGRIQNNPSIQVQSGSGTGIGTQVNNNATGVVLISGNTVTNVPVDAGITAIALGKTNNSPGGTLNATITSNNVTISDIATNNIETRSGSGSVGETNQPVCVNVANNTIGDPTPGVGNAFGGIFTWRARVANAAPNATLNVQNFNTNIATTWTNNGNTPNAGTSQSVAGGGTPIGSCTTTLPANPVLDADFAPPSGTIGIGAQSASSSSSQQSDVISRPFVSLPQAAKPAKGTAQVAASVQLGAVDAQQQQAPVSKTEGGAKSSSSKNSQVVVNATQTNISVQIGTLRPLDSVTITFQVTVNLSIPSNVQQVSNQGTVTADGPISVLTDDTAFPGASDPTVTPVLTPPDIAINDAKAPEPTSSTSTMLFTVTLNHAFTSPVTVNFASVDQTPGAGHAIGGALCSDPNVDYLSNSGSVGFAAGQTVQTVPITICSDANNTETDETFLVNLSVNNIGAITDAQAVGTITTANPAGTLLISELRTSGPGTLGTGDADDDFVELYNNTSSPITVNVTDGSGGWGVYKSSLACVDSPVLVGVVPNNTTIPAFGHFLLTGSGYSLSNYPAGNNAATSPTPVATTATGDAQLNATPTSPNIEADRNVAVFSTANLANISSANRFDAVGFTPANTGANCDLLREVTNVPGAGAGAITAQYSFLRIPTTGMSQDTNNNAADFQVVSTTTSAVGLNTPTLGAPGPENLTSPTLRTTTINSTLVDPCQSTSAVPNRVRNASSYTDPAPSTGSGTGTYTLGTLLTRRKFTNNTGASVTRLRFRIVDITTAIPPVGIADLRAITSQDTPGVAITGACGGGTVLVRGTTLETPPAQPNGGGLNSTLSTGTVSLAQPLTNGSSINIQFLLGVKQGGSFRFFIIVEALP
jgi:hypothetical protein